jgi:hypothetical protein
MAASIRLTRSGACASCGAYGNSTHPSTCQPELIRRFKLRFSARCQRDRAVSAAMRDRDRLENDALRSYERQLVY